MASPESGMVFLVGSSRLYCRGLAIQAYAFGHLRCGSRLRAPAVRRTPSAGQIEICGFPCLKSETWGTRTIVGGGRRKSKRRSFDCDQDDKHILVASIRMTIYRYPRSPNARDLHPTDEDLSVGTPDLGHPSMGHSSQGHPTLCLDYPVRFGTA